MKCIEAKHCPALCNISYKERGKQNSTVDLESMLDQIRFEGPNIRGNCKAYTSSKPNHNIKVDHVNIK